MTKNDIVLEIANDTGLAQTDVKRVVQQTLDRIIDILATEGRLELRNFGVFSVRTRGPRRARNPRTGVKVMVPERKVVVFKPGKVMEERVIGDAPAVPLDEAAPGGQASAPQAQEAPVDVSVAGESRPAE